MDIPQQTFVPKPILLDQGTTRTPTLQGGALPRPLAITQLDRLGPAASRAWSPAGSAPRQAQPMMVRGRALPGPQPGRL